MKITVVLLFKSGTRETCEIEWDKSAGPPQADVVNSLGGVGLVTCKGSIVRWNPHHVDFIEIDGDFNEMIEGEGEGRDEKHVSLNAEPLEMMQVKCQACQAEMWLDITKTAQGTMRIGECPRCGMTESSKLELNDD